MIEEEHDMASGMLFPTPPKPRAVYSAPQLHDASQPFVGRLQLRLSSFSKSTSNQPASTVGHQRIQHSRQRAMPQEQEVQLQGQGSSSQAGSVRGRQNMDTSSAYLRSEHTVPEGKQQPQVVARANNAAFDENVYLTKLVAAVSHEMGDAALTRDKLVQQDAATAQAEYALEGEKGLEDMLRQRGADKLERVHPTMSKTLEPFKQVMLVTATHLEPCHSMAGSHLTMLGIKNKADYAKIHGYGFHWATEEPDPLMVETWNKIAVLQMLADKYNDQEVGWFLWLDADTLILDMDRALPVDRWHDRNIVVWGCSENLLTTFDALGFNGGAMLLRNGAWLRDLLETVAADYGRRWDSDYQPGRPAFEEINSQVEHFDRGLFEQAAIMHIMYRFPDMRPYMTCDNSESWHILYRFNDWTVDKYKTESSHPFVVHWPGCQFCRASWLPSSSVVKDCMTTYTKTFAFAHNASMRLLGEGFGVDIKRMLDLLTNSIEDEWRVKDTLWVHAGQEAFVGKKSL